MKFKSSINFNTNYVKNALIIQQEKNIRKILIIRLVVDADLRVTQRERTYMQLVFTNNAL